MLWLAAAPAVPALLAPHDPSSTSSVLHLLLVRALRGFFAAARAGVLQRAGGVRGLGPKATGGAVHRF